MRATTDTRGQVTARMTGRLIKRLGPAGWFVALWLCGVLAAGALAAIFKVLMLGAVR